MSIAHIKIVREYHSIIAKKIRNINDDVDLIKRNLTVHINIILATEEKVYPNGILEYVKRIKAGISNYNKYKIDELYKGNKNKIETIISSPNRLAAYLINDTLSNIIPIRYRVGMEVDEVESIASAYVNFYKYALKYHKLQERIIMYENIQLSDFVIGRFITLYFDIASKYLLRLKHSKLRLPHKIFIYVYGKSRLDEKGDKPRVKVDWGATNRRLKEIAKDVDIVLYERYISKHMTKIDFYDAMKKYTYDKNTNPDGIKYLVYLDKPINHWLIVFHKYSSLFGIRNYGITPTNFIENETRSQIDFGKTVKNVDDIINSNLLGFRDKIRALERYDIDFCRRNYLNYIHNDI